MAEVTKDKKDDAPSQPTLQYVGLDLSYSVNKKAHNMLDATALDTFLKSQNISEGVQSIASLVSFGDDRYGFKYTDSSGDSPCEAVSGFTFEKGSLCPLLESAQHALSGLSSPSEWMLSNIASGQEAVLFNNTTSTFKMVDLFSSKQAKTFTSSDEDNVVEDFKDNGNGKDDMGDLGSDPKVDLKSDKTDSKEPVANGSVDTPKSDENGSGKKDPKLLRKKSGSSDPKFKVKTSIKSVYKHLLLTANGSLYGLTPKFHKKYFGNKRVLDARCDGSRCTLALDENGVLWSFGINMFGKLGLKRNDKKQVYTNPREIQLFKAYKVKDFGITNRCCVAVCANGQVYGWGSCSKDMDGKDSDIWYTPQAISVRDQDPKKRKKWRVYCGFRFMVFVDEASGLVVVANTEFGFHVREKAKYGLLIETHSVQVPADRKVVDVIASSETAVLVMQ